MRTSSWRYTVSVRLVWFLVFCPSWTNFLVIHQPTRLLLALTSAGVSMPDVTALSRASRAAGVAKVKPERLCATFRPHPNSRGIAGCCCCCAIRRFNVNLGRRYHGIRQVAVNPLGGGLKSDSTSFVLPDTTTVRIVQRGAAPCGGDSTS